MTPNAVAPIEQRPSLYELLPAVHRVRDAVEGNALRGLLRVIEEQVEILQGDIDRLYDDWFAETCEEWVVPYIGDLLGVNGILPIPGAPFSQRGLVANTIAYRRAKGTAAVLEQLARDVTGWPAKALEFFELLATTRQMNHERRSDIATVDVRGAARAELVGTPFGTALHTADVRHVDNSRGRYNIPNVGIHVWRLQDYGLQQVTARGAGAPGTYRFNPLGIDGPLFNVPRAERDITQLASELNVPGPLRRRPLHDELEARRQAVADSTAGLVEGAGLAEALAPRWFDERQPVFRVSLLDPATPEPVRREIPPERVVICNLSGSDAVGWRRPPTSKFYVPTGGGDKVELPIEVGVDPVLGRLAFPDGEDPEGVEVAFSYGFPGDLGGGPYDRRASLAIGLPEIDPEEPTHLWQKGVGRERDDPAPVALDLVETLAEAIADWNTQPAGTQGVIAILDSRTYEEDLTGARRIVVPAGSRLVITAASWPVDRDEQGAQVRRPGRIVPVALRPHLRGAIEAVGEPGDDPETPGGALVIDGLLVEGEVTVQPGDLGLLRLAHVTLAPPAGTVTVDADPAPGRQNRRLEVEIERSICTQITIADRVGAVSIADSIVGGGGEPAITAPDTRISRTTVLGPTEVRTIEGSNSIFAERLHAERRQSGCLRYSYLPLESSGPRRFRCQPKDAAAADSVAPDLVGREYGSPAYCQLARQCAREISRGAEEDGEMGAWGFLEQPRRVDNLTVRLDEYLRFGLEAGVFFVT